MDCLLTILCESIYHAENFPAKKIVGLIFSSWGLLAGFSRFEKTSALQHS